MMTREEAIRQLQSLRGHCQSMLCGEYEDRIWMQDIEALDLAIAALRPVSREQVRRGTIIETIKDGRANRVFSCCGHDFTELTCWFMPDFCPSCGAPMTDEAVQMVMERMEALYETT